MNWKRLSNNKIDNANKKIWTIFSFKFSFEYFSKKRNIAKENNKYLKWKKEEYFKSSVIWNMALNAMYIENKVKIIIFLSKKFFLWLKLKTKKSKKMSANISATTIPKIKDNGKKNNGI